MRQFRYKIISDTNESCWMSKKEARKTYWIEKGLQHNPICKRELVSDSRNKAITYKQLGNELTRILNGIAREDGLI